jgi:hypothetical protein
MEEDRIAWHPAFFEAVQLELEPYFDDLEFHYEEQLNAEPLKIDVLIIKKKKDAVIDRPLAGIFRGHNILEFKSHTDYLSVNDFYKVYGYACFYKALKNIDISDITITFVETKYPREAIAHLREEKGYKITEQAGGIHIVEGGVDKIPVQFIETKKLSSRDSGYVRVLGSNLDAETVNYVMEEAKKPHRAQIGAFLDAVLRANVNRLEEVMAMGGKTLEEVLEKAGLTAKWEARGEARGEAGGEARRNIKIAQTLIQKGLPIEETAEITELDLKTLEPLYRGA